MEVASIYIQFRFHRVKNIHGKLGDPLSQQEQLYKMTNVIYLSLSEIVQTKADNASDVLVNETHVQKVGSQVHHTSCLENCKNVDFIFTIFP